MHPEWEWHIFSLTRASDPDRSVRFRNVLGRLKAFGAIGDLDDGPEQKPVEMHSVQKTVMDLIGSKCFHLIITHGPKGEYTRHKRHEEVCEAVCRLWIDKKLAADQLWLYAYTDNEGARLPSACKNAHVIFKLPENIRQQKYMLLTEDYGFSDDSWEARALPGTEAFWCFDSAQNLQDWLDQKEGFV